MNRGVASGTGLPVGLGVLSITDHYAVAVWRNVMILRITGEIDTNFLRKALDGHYEALAHTPEGYGVVTIAERSAKVPPSYIRTEASHLRKRTQDMLRAQAVILGGEGFFASAMRAVITGILSMAQSRVPLRMMGTNHDAASFIAAEVCGGGSAAQALEEALTAVRGLTPEDLPVSKAL